MSQNQQDKNTANPSSRIWLGMIVFSAVMLLLSGAALYKSVMARFNPAPERTHDALAQAPSLPLQAAPAPQEEKEPAPQAQAEPAPEQAPEQALPGQAKPAQEQAVREPEPEPKAEEQAVQPVAEQSSKLAPETTAAEKAPVKARRVRFEYNSPESDKVLLCGTFISWRTTAMKRHKGKWTAELYMHPGDYQYYFVVNGVKTPDPLQPLRKGKNSVLVVR